MCKINSSEHNILSYKCNDLKFCEHEFNSAQSANFVSTNPVVDTEQDWKLNTTMRVLSVFAGKFWREI